MPNTTTNLKLLHDGRLLLLIGLLILICMYDLLSPPISVTISRQTQTAMLTENFVKEGFSLSGLYLGLKGSDKYMLVLEFPVYNFVVGLLFYVFKHNPFWGKLVSLMSSVFTLVVFYRLIKSTFDDSIAFYSALFFILTPVGILMYTSFQPDALGLMFMMCAIFLLNQWRFSLNIGIIALFSISLLFCGLCKFPLLVPYIPICGLMFFFPKGKFRFPKFLEIIIITILFLLPFVFWYLYRAHITDPTFAGGETSMFLIGDLGRFLSLNYYLKPAIMLTMLAFCGIGIIYFMIGFQGVSYKEIALIIGIPLYFVIVPAVSNQYYYLLTIVPITALFMGRGFMYTLDYFKYHRIGLIGHILFACYLMFFAFGVAYVLRMDNVILPACEAMQQVSKPDDLIFIVPMHDRGNGVGGINPTVAYFTKRNGWNVQEFTPQKLSETITQIEDKQKQGAKWLFVTWYTSDVEPWYSPMLPERFKRKLDFDSEAIADELKRRYQVANSGKNFAILSLMSRQP
jgi:hypothetical protein